MGKINNSNISRRVVENNQIQLNNQVKKNVATNPKETSETVANSAAKLGDLEFTGKMKKADLTNTVAMQTGENKSAKSSKTNFPENEYDGKLVDANGNSHPAKTPLSQLQGVKPNNQEKLLTNEPIIFVGGVDSDVKRDLDIQQKIANKTGAEVFSLHNGAEGKLTDLQQWNGDRAEMDSHHSEQWSLDKGQNPYKKFKNYAEYEKFYDNTFGKNKATSGLTETLTAQAGKDTRLFVESQGFPISSNALSRLKAKSYYAAREAGIVRFRQQNNNREPSGKDLENIERNALSISKNRLSKISLESYGGAGNFLPKGLGSSTHYVNSEDAIATNVGPTSKNSDLGSNAEVVNLSFKNADGLDGLTKNHAIEFYLQHRPDDKQAGRLSNSWTMKKNYIAQLNKDFTKQGLTGKKLDDAVSNEVKRISIHHLIPDELVQKTELGKLAQRAGYNLDSADNLIGLPKSKALKNNPNEVGHWTSHPKYTEQVRKEMETEINALKAKYQNKAIPKQEILDAMKRIERKFRQNINNGNVPQKDGRLAELPNTETTA